ncbi:MAG: pantetheine-phosphate adenylyltransferase [Acidobacteria bacterium]|nr:pantetheine-phosphate adenylyltransferase [Acidobacteriota bacterium]
MRIRRAIYPGSFDPITNGHLDVIERSRRLFDEIIVAVLVNIEKKPLFNFDERIEIIRTVVANSPEVKVDTFDGLLVNYAQAKQAGCIIRGIRAISDYEYELQMALMNRRLAPNIETVFMMAAEPYSYLSSRLVKEVFMLNGSITGLVPELVEQKMKEKFKQS